MSEEMNLETAEGWRPEEGDTVIGTVVVVDAGWSDFKNGYYPIITVQPDDGAPVAVHCFHDVLEKRVTDLRPEPGDTIGIKYQGKRKTKDGNREVAIYTVRVKGKSPVSVWDTRLAPATAPAQSDIPATLDEGHDDIPF